ncbi:hypothetical protein [Marinimicrococcus flavescens]|uniref:S-layer family protein n=1 Tax=Marinimicrococcus flavescens TaxID=3031815 RepID=A0AAP3XPA7_9PROT|nr:hypothetical protein [Marinimicrococcus flavescens]
MSSLKKRLLLSLSAAALAAPMAAGSAQAIEVVVLDQVNLAAQSAELSFGGLWGESLAATAAAIGNSAAFNIEGVDDAAALELDQVNPASTQLADIDLHDIDLGAGGADGIALTAAAIGNTLSGTGEGQIASLDITQSVHRGQSAAIVLDQVVVSGLESSLSAAAIGNSASLTAGAIGTGDGFDTLLQTNTTGQNAGIDIADLAVLPTETGAVLDATAAAIGNSLTLTATTGDLFLDGLDQNNVGSGQSAGLILDGVNDLGVPHTPVGVTTPSFETFDSTLVAAAIGNSATLEAAGNILLDEVEQLNVVAQNASLDLDQVYGLGALDGTAVAIGNSLSISADGALALDKIESGVDQDNHSTQSVAIRLDDLGLDGAVDLTAAAIANSLSLSSGGDFALNEGSLLDQLNTSGQSADVTLGGLDGVGDLSATVVAIGNSLSLSSGGDLAFDADGAIEQTNHGSQTVIGALTELNGTGAGELTLAAIGNSVSLDTEGAVSGAAPTITQFNTSAQTAVLSLTEIGDLASLDVTGVAIGNSLSLAAGSFEGTGTLSISQETVAGQSVSLSLGSAGLGALSATTAAIGNSASVTIR